MNAFGVSNRSASKAFRWLHKPLAATLFLYTSPTLAEPPLAVAPKQFASTAPASTPVLGNSFVEKFYAERNESPVWFRDGGGAEAVAGLAAILRRAPLDGLASGPALAEAVQAAGTEAANGTTEATARADRELSNAWIAFITALNRPNDGGLIWAESSLAPSPPNAMRTLELAAIAPSLPKHLESVAFVNPIYSKLRDAAFTMLKRTGAAPEARLLANLDRARVFPRKGKYIVVNSATQRLTMVEDGQIVDSMKVIVGRPDAQTPMLASIISYATVNPYWYVPTDLTQKVIAKKMQSGSAAAYWAEKRYEVISDFGPNPTLLELRKIDWKAVERGERTVFVRQLPGNGNSMGKVKYRFPNNTGVYLHDTNLPELFAMEHRTLSNGCVRLEDAQRLGRWMMGHEVVANTSEPEQHLALPRGVPVFLTYITAVQQDGAMTFVNDVYGRDGTAKRGADPAPPVSMRTLVKSETIGA